MFRYENGDPLILDHGMLVKDGAQYYFRQLSLDERTAFGIVEIPETFIAPVLDPKTIALNSLTNTDAVLPRYVEDLVDTLVAKGLIATTDLSETLQANYIEKKTLREEYLTISTIVEEVL